VGDDMAAILDILIEQGATFRHTLLVKQGGLPFDLTSYTVRMQVRRSYSVEALLLELTESNGRILVDPEEGRIDLSIDAEDTEALSFKDGVYDLEIESVGGEVTRLLQGVVTLSPEVTR
jgi:hypothetical protein